tara:strand:+ start:505 stop:744 length:240 start_codon:yes stop_codon:yes gene_type:complete
MPKYGGIHYPNDQKGITNGYPTHVVDKNSTNKFGTKSHVSKGKDTFGNFTKKDLNDGASGLRKTRVLREDPASLTNYPT